MLLLMMMIVIIIIIIIDTRLALTLSRWHFIHQSIVIANRTVLQHSKQLHQYLYHYPLKVLGTLPRSKQTHRPHRQTLHWWHPGS